MELKDLYHQPHNPPTPTNPFNGIERQINRWLVPDEVDESIQWN
jgi:hypothetical protein